MPSIPITLRSNGIAISNNKAPMRGGVGKIVMGWTQLRRAKAGRAPAGPLRDLAAGYSATAKRPALTGALLSRKRHPKAAIRRKQRPARLPNLAAEPRKGSLQLAVPAPAAPGAVQDSSRRDRAEPTPRKGAHDCWSKGVELKTVLIASTGTFLVRW